MPAGKVFASGFILKRLQRQSSPRTALLPLRQKVTGAALPWRAGRGRPGQSSTATLVAGATNVAPSPPSVRRAPTLAQLHTILHIVFAWSDAPLHSLHIHGRGYGSSGTNAPTHMAQCLAAPSRRAVAVCVGLWCPREHGRGPSRAASNCTCMRRCSSIDSSPRRRTGTSRSSTGRCWRPASPSCSSVRGCITSARWTMRSSASSRAASRWPARAPQARTNGPTRRPRTPTAIWAWWLVC